MVSGITVAADVLPEGKPSGRVAGGAVAARLLSALGISFCTYTRAIGPVQIQNFSREEIFNNKLYMPDSEAAEKASEYLESCMAAKNSAGGIIECVIHGTPAGLGEPVFDKLDASLAKAVMSIGAVKGVEIGDGFQVAASTGLTDNDGFHIRPDGTIEKTSNHAGGILGGISDGSDIILRAAIKPTPSIASEQQTVSRAGEEITLSIKGRHDPVIVPRAVVVVRGDGCPDTGRRSADGQRFKAGKLIQNLEIEHNGKTGRNSSILNFFRLFIRHPVW